MNSPDFDAIIRGLDAHKSGDQYSAKCPAHDDGHASLSLGKPNGKIVFKCHAGCSQDEIISALRAGGLWSESNKQIVATYDYVNENGALVFQSVRYQPKDFRQRRPDGSDEWIWNLQGVNRVLFNLPPVLSAVKAGDTIVIVEGEKDVENLRKIGITATTNAGGAGKWRQEYSHCLKGARVVILPDNDEPGRTHADQVAKSLTNIAAQIKVIELPGLPPKGDVSDWLTAGGTREALLSIFANASASASARADPQPHAEKESVPRFPRVWIDDACADLGGDYLVKCLIERGRLCVIYGPSGDGKTFFTADLAAHIAAGIPWRGHRVHRGLVAYIAAEAGTSILRRFFALREHRMGEAREDRIPLAIITRGANLLKMVDVEALLAELRAIAKESGLPLALVIFDTLSRSIPGGDENKAEDMTKVVEAADLIRDELGAATAIVHHTGKDNTKGARGHSSLFGAADTVVSVIERVAMVEKSRDGMSGETFPFALDVVDLGADADGDPITTCIVAPCAMSVASEKAARLTVDEQLALDCLNEELAVSGQALPETSAIPRGARGVRVDDWRARFYSRLGDTRDLEQNAKRQAWHRGRKRLIGRRLVACWNDLAWLNGSERQSHET
jgi:hypothetical protein